jgi:hypothetical protein
MADLTEPPQLELPTDNKETSVVEEEKIIDPDQTQEKCANAETKQDDEDTEKSPEQAEPTLPDETTGDVTANEPDVPIDFVTMGMFIIG